MLSIIQAAGWPIWPLILCSMLALAFIVERFISLKPARVLSAGLVDEAIEVSRNAVPTPDTVNQLEQHSALGAVLAAGWRAINTNPRCTAADMRAAIEAAGPGQVLVPSFQGSRVEGMSEEEYIADHATTARLVKETGAKLMVMNTSCPNEGHNRLLCHNPLLVGRITEAVKQEIGDIPLMVKLAYIPSDGDLELMVRSTVGHGTVQGFSTINTISAKLVDANGNQALPGAGRDRSGVCGNAIRGAGLDMVARLAAIREKLGLDFKINGVGGVVSPADYQAYRNAGADSVMSATGAMWDAELAHKIKASR